MSDPEPPPPDATCDGGDLDCGSGLLLIIRKAMSPLSPGSVLLVKSREISVKEDLPAWCRMVGHSMLAECPASGGYTHYFLRKKVEDDAAWHGDVEQTDTSGSDPEAFLIAAIEYANTELWGTLGANILIHPRTIREIGTRRFEEILADFRYGTIGINGWCGIGFLIAACPWGAYPGHTLEDVGSGIGTVHNAFMLENTEKVVLRAPWRPFPRGVLSGQFTLLPRPPFFITNRRQHKIGEALTRFEYRPGWLKLPGIFLNALLG